VRPVKIPLRDAGAISIGIELVVSVVLGLLAGAWLDRRFGTGPWLTLLGIAIGSAAGFRSLLQYTRRAAARMEREDAAEEAAKKPTASDANADAAAATDDEARDPEKP
jgi:F0F1-type ATP synthase assembly protein I